MAWGVRKHVSKQENKHQHITNYEWWWWRGDGDGWSWMAMTDLLQLVGICYKETNVLVIPLGCGHILERQQLLSVSSGVTTILLIMTIYWTLIENVPDWGDWQTIPEWREECPGSLSFVPAQTSSVSGKQRTRRDGTYCGIFAQSL